MKITLFVILAYLLGSLMPGYWIGKLIYHKDIRNLGSGNIGTTNSFRTLGVVPGIIIMILDISKGLVAVIIPQLFGIHNESYLLLIGIFAVIGHVYSIFLGFHGGKAVATSAGVVLGISPTLFIFAAIILILGILISSMVSFSSILTFILATLFAYFYMHSVPLTVFAFVATLIMLYAHRKNIIRILNNTESKVPFGINYWLTKQK
jgi:glycerol-3-phosphate acyltransferase PlsY